MFLCEMTLFSCSLLAADVLRLSCGVDRDKPSRNQDKTLKMSFFFPDGAVVTLLIQRRQRPPLPSSCCRLSEGRTGSASTQQLHLTTAEWEEEPALCSVGCENYSSTKCDKCKKKITCKARTNSTALCQSGAWKHTHTHKQGSGKCFWELVFLDNVASEKVLTPCFLFVRYDQKHHIPVYNYTGLSNSDYCSLITLCCIFAGLWTFVPHNKGFSLWSGWTRGTKNSFNIQYTYSICGYVRQIWKGVTLFFNFKRQ